MLKKVQRRYLITVKYKMVISLEIIISIKVSRLKILFIRQCSKVYYFDKGYNRVKNVYDGILRWLYVTEK